MLQKIYVHPVGVVSLANGNMFTAGDGFFAGCPRLCRVLFIGRSAKRLFAECQRENTRQTTGTRQRGGNTRQNWSLPSVILLTLDKGRRR